MTTQSSVHRDRRILFVQATMAEAYPPIINAALLVADAGWDVHVLTAPIAGKVMAFPAHGRITLHRFRERPTHVMSKASYARYTWAAVALARKLKVDVVYASDPLGGGAGLASARASGARLIYHEHDSPEPGGQSLLYRLRSVAARGADLVVLPNAERARLAQAEIGFPAERLRIVWNVPRRAEVLPECAKSSGLHILYYHGTLTPARLPLTIVEAVKRFEGRVELHFAGYTVAGAWGYVAELERSGAHDGRMLVRNLGMISREDVLAAASRAHVGLALMPMTGGDVNMRHMTGASNKIFDYMAAGAVPIVSDVPDWRQMFVDAGYALACDPADVASIAGVVGRLLDAPGLREQIAGRNRAKIAAEWNYDTQFEPVLQQIQSWCQA